MQMGDKIVVMNNAVVEQFGTPQEIYDMPATMFVADFIGSPSMNFLDGELYAEGGKLSVKGNGFSLPVSDRLRSKAEGANQKAVVVGLRPEHFSATSDGVGQKAEISLNVDVAEYIGSSQFLAASIDGKQITATVDVGPDASPMESGTYYFDVDRMYLFDKETGLSI